MQAVNLTPHLVTIVDGEGEALVSIPPSGTVARAASERRVVGTVDVEGTTVPVTETVFGDVSGLPDPQDGTVYIVSRIVADAAPHRTDLYGVDDTARDEDGKIVGARALTRFGR